MWANKTEGSCTYCSNTIHAKKHAAQDLENITDIVAISYLEQIPRFFQIFFLNQNKGTFETFPPKTMPLNYFNTKQLK